MPYEKLNIDSIPSIPMRVLLENQIRDLKAEIANLESLGLEEKVRDILFKKEELKMLEGRLQPIPENKKPKAR